MKKLQVFFLRFIGRYLKKRLDSDRVQGIVRYLYQEHVRSEFVIKTEIVKVKKGERRYLVAYTEGIDFKRKIWITRYSEMLEGVQFDDITDLFKVFSSSINLDL